MSHNITYCKGSDVISETNTMPESVSARSSRITNIQWLRSKRLDDLIIERAKANTNIGSDLRQLISCKNIMGNN